MQNLWLHNGMSVADYYKEFNMLVKIAENCGSEFAATIWKECYTIELHDKVYKV